MGGEKKEVPFLLKKRQCKEGNTWRRKRNINLAYLGRGVDRMRKPGVCNPSYYCSAGI